MSVCICTRNRADVIEDAVWSVVLQSAEAEMYEVLIVDNGSGDAAGLRSLVEQCAVRGRDLRVVEEPEPGLSHARNRAARESRGEYVFFLDDDAIAGPRWVERNLAAISTHRPDVIGGHVLPLFAVHPGEELDYSIWPQWSLKHFGSADRWLAEGEYFLGCNMGALRKLLLEEPYDPALGRKGEALGGGEEWYLGDSRFRRRLVSEAYVFHKVPAERLSIDYLASRSVAYRKSPSRHSALKQLWIKAGALRFVLREIRGFGRKVWLRLRLALAIRRLRRQPRDGTEGEPRGVVTMREQAKRVLRMVRIDGLASELLRIPRRISRKLRRADDGIVESYFRAHEVRKLHIGCGGSVLEGWLNVDLLPRSAMVIPIDATETFPFGDEQFDYIFSEHMIEHFEHSRGSRMLSESYRTLKKNGKIRVSTPDLAFLVDLYREDKSDLQNAYIRWATAQFIESAPGDDDTFVINNFVRDWGHQFIYDEKTLSASLKKAGFARITRCEINESEEEVLRNLENEERLPDGFLRLETMTLEGTKLAAR